MTCRCPENRPITTQRDYQIHFGMQLQYFFFCKENEHKNIDTVSQDLTQLK